MDPGRQIMQVRALLRSTFRGALYRIRAKTRRYQCRAPTAAVTAMTLVAPPFPESLARAASRRGRATFDSIFLPPSAHACTIRARNANPSRAVSPANRTSGPARSVWGHRSSVNGILATGATANITAYPNITAYQGHSTR